MRIHFGTTSTTTKMGKGKQGGEKKQNERKRRGEKEGGGDCFCIDEIWDMRTRRGQEEDCYASEDCSAHFPGPTTVIIHTSRAACRQCHAGQAQKGCRFKFRFCRANVRTHCCQKRLRPSRNVDDYCVGRLRRGAPDRDIILIPVLDWGNIKLVVWPHDSGVFLCVGITFASFLLRTCVQNYVRGRSGSGPPFVIHSCHLLDREDDVRVRRSKSPPSLKINTFDVSRPG